MVIPTENFFYLLLIIVLLINTFRLRIVLSTQYNNINIFRDRLRTLRNIKKYLNKKGIKF